MIAGNQNAFVFGLKIDTWAGGAINSFLGFALNLFAAMQFNIFAAGNLEINHTCNIVDKGVVLDSERVKIENLTMADITSGNVKIGKQNLDVELGQKIEGL
jgi:hypothetical protein